MNRADGPEWNGEPLPAVESVPFGAPVRGEGEGLAVWSGKGAMVGVARRRPDAGPQVQSYEPGELVEVQRDGGISARLPVDIDVEVRGTTVRLLAADPHYLELHDGAIVGFQGDGRVCHD